MKRKSILLVLCIGMILTSCESKISLNSTDVKNEKEIVIENYSYQYTLVVELANKSNPPLDEGKIIHFVMCELLGNPCEMYKGMKNPIISLRKDYDR